MRRECGSVKALRSIGRRAWYPVPFVALLRGNRGLRALRRHVRRMSTRRERSEFCPQGRQLHPCRVALRLRFRDGLGFEFPCVIGFSQGVERRFRDECRFRRIAFHDRRQREAESIEDRPSVVRVAALARGLRPQRMRRERVVSVKRSLRSLALSHPVQVRTPIARIAVDLPKYSVLFTMSSACELRTLEQFTLARCPVLASLIQPEGVTAND